MAENLNSIFWPFLKEGISIFLVHQVTPKMSPSGPGVSCRYSSAVPGTLTGTACEDINTSHPCEGLAMGC